MSSGGITPVGSPPPPTASVAFQAVIARRGALLLDHHRWLRWGTQMRALIQQKDKGGSFFNHIENSRRQLERIVQQS